MAARSPYQATPLTDLDRFIDARDMAHRQVGVRRARSAVAWLAELVVLLATWTALLALLWLASGAVR